MKLIQNKIRFKVHPLRKRAINKEGILRKHQINRIQNHHN